MRQTAQRRGWRATPHLLAALTVGVAMLGLDTGPAQADPNPVEDHFADSENGFSVIWDEDGDYDNDDCEPGVAPGWDFTIVYPDGLGAFGEPHPVIVWGNGTNLEPDTTPNPTCIDAYEASLKHLASWGFVVIAPNVDHSGSGQELLEAVGVAHWINADETSPFHEKLDTDSIAAVGHSQGAVGAINATLDAPAGTIDSILALSMPDQGWINYWNTTVVPACPAINDLPFVDLTCPPLEIAPDATENLDVPIFFARGTGLQNAGCEVDDLFSDQTHIDWRPDNTSVPYAFATVKVPPPDGNPEDLCDPQLPWWIQLLGFPSPHPWNLYPHLPFGATGYATSWLMYTLTCNGTSEDAFTGATPEISQNTNWNPPPGTHHSVILNNLPTCP